MGTYSVSNEDWLRSRSWDLPLSVDYLLDLLNVADSDLPIQRDAVARFMAKPAAIPMPQSMRDELAIRGLIE